MKINNGDYIETKYFTKEEGEIFQQIMVYQGIKLDETVNDFWDNEDNWDRFGQGQGETYFGDYGSGILKKRNLTEEFRQYLDDKNKTKGFVKSLGFTKADLIDGDIVETVEQGKYVKIETKLINFSMGFNYLSSYNDDLIIPNHPDYKITSVSRGGEIIWTRPSAKVISKETAELIREAYKAGYLQSALDDDIEDVYSEPEREDLESYMNKFEVEE